MFLLLWSPALVALKYHGKGKEHRNAPTTSKQESKDIYRTKQ